jgi:hypothetical protein
MQNGTLLLYYTLPAPQVSTVMIFNYPLTHI